MSFYEFRQAGVMEIDFGQRIDTRRGAPTFLVMTSIDPVRGQADSAGWNEIVMDALCGMQDVAGRESRSRELIEHETKVPLVRFVASDLLGREDAEELDSELPLAVAKGSPIDVGQHDESVVTLQIYERFGTVRKGRPSPD